MSTTINLDTLAQEAAEALRKAEDDVAEAELDLIGAKNRLAFARGQMAMIHRIHQAAQDVKIEESAQVVISDLTAA